MDLICTVSQCHRSIPDALSLHNREICIVNQGIKVLLPSHCSKSSESVSTSSSVDHNRKQLQETNLSVNAPVFIPTKVKPKSTQVSVPASANVEHIQPKRIVLPCFGIDMNIYHYIFKIDDNGNLIAEFNAKIPPPKHLKDFKFAICVPTQVGYVRARGELFSDQLTLDREDTTDDVKSKDVGVQVDYVRVIHRYNREKLLKLINVKDSSSEPNLSSNVRRLINNNQSHISLHDILEIADDSAFDNTFSIRKSISAISLTDKTLSSDGSSPLLHKSLSCPATDFSTSSIRKFRSCLNKLSVDNFQTILDEMKCIKITEDAIIFKLIDILYAKATREPMFASHYVKILMALKNDFVVSENRKSFEDLAITACEKTHEDAKLKLCKVSQLSQDCCDKLRHDLVGGMKFLAEMFENQILSLDFIIKILQDLLDLKCVESIEPLCKLLEFLTEKNISDKRMVGVFNSLDQIQNNFTTRIRFMIQNVLEKYRNNFDVNSVKSNCEDIYEMKKSENSNRRQQKSWRRGQHNSRRFTKQKN